MSLKQIKLDKIFRNTTRKDGTPYVDKRGKGFTVVVIQSGQSKASYCDYEDKTAEWQIGDTVQVSIEKNGEYTNFSPPSKLDLLEMRVEALELQLQGSKPKNLANPTPQAAQNTDDMGGLHDFPPDALEPPQNDDSGLPF